MAVNFYRAGNWMLDTPSGLITLIFSGTVTIGNMQTLKKQDGSAAGGVSYQVTAGKTLYLVQGWMSQGGANGSMRVGYADAAVDNGAVSASFRYMTGNYYMPVAFTTYTQPVFIAIPATKFPSMVAVNNANPDVTFLGFEV